MNYNYFINTIFGDYIKISLDTSFDLKNIICLYFYDLKDIINLYNLDKDHQDNILITNLYDIPIKYLKKLNQQIIEQNKYKNVEKLRVKNRNIKNLNHMKNNLKILDCCFEFDYNYIGNMSTIDQEGISELNLIQLNANSNEKIKNVNHMKNTLKILYCWGVSGIDQNGISELNLIELYAWNNEKIKDVNHMKKTLKILNCSSNSGIDQNGISELNLIKLNAIYNNKITNVNLIK